MKNKNDMNAHEFFGLITFTLVLLAAIALGSKHANAANKDYYPTESLPIYQKECGSCHLAYPPAFLPKSSWSEIMKTLSKHYGTDASLDEKNWNAINQWLSNYGGTYKRVRENPPDNRITQSEWFKRKHRKIDPKDFTKPSVKSPANCSACHQNAEKGIFDDDDTFIPR